MRPAALLLALPLLATVACKPADAGPGADAGSDAEKVIAQCISDNKNEGAQREVVRKYCACMRGKMGPGETQSITAWEEDKPEAVKACDKVAGWK